MTQPRLSTVYDYANLRLHPDGTRVYQKADNARPHLVRITTQGPRESWIARDASGSGKVSQFRKGKSRQKDASEEPGEEIDLDGDEGAEGKSDERSKEEGEENSDEDGGDDPDDSDYGGPSGKRKLSQHDKRKLKRQKFAANFDYLSEPQSLPIHGSQHSTEADNSQTIEQELPQPSTDLLKSIHRFAAEFYTEKGQLLNISREYRKERKLRRLQKLGKLGKQRRRSKARRSGSSAGSGTRDVSEEDEEEGSSKEASGEEDDGDAEDEDEEGDDEEDEDEDEEEEEEEDGESDSQEDEDDTVTKKTPRKDVKGKGKPKPKAKRKKNPRSKKLYRDMYKMFDGSAILAIGMLVQEMIVDMVDTQMPVGWKEEMEQAYGSRIDDFEDQLDVEAVIGGENETQGRQPERNKDKKREEKDEEQEYDQDEDEEEELEGNEEQEDGDDENEDHGIAVTSKVGSPPLTQNDDDSDVEMNEVASDLETHDEEESDDDSD